MNPSSLLDEWLARAGDDDKSAHILREESGPPNTICFLAQQAAEKYLKAYLVSHREKPPRIHDLIKLLELCANHVSAMRDDAALLTEYAIDARYPGDVPEYTQTEAQEALQAASNIKEEITATLRQKKS